MTFSFFRLGTKNHDATTVLSANLGYNLQAPTDYILVSECVHALEPRLAPTTFEVHFGFWFEAPGSKQLYTI